VIWVFYASEYDLPKKFVGDLLTQNRIGLANTAKERPSVRTTQPTPATHWTITPTLGCTGHNRSAPHGYRAPTKMQME